MQSEFEVAQHRHPEAARGQHEGPTRQVSRNVDQMVRRCRRPQAGDPQDARLIGPEPARVHRRRLPRRRRSRRGATTRRRPSRRCLHLLDQAQTAIWNNLQTATTRTSTRSRPHDPVSTWTRRCRSSRSSSAPCRRVSTSGADLMDSFDLDVRLGSSRSARVMTDYWDANIMRPSGLATPCRDPGNYGRQITAILGDNTTPPGTTAWVPRLVRVAREDARQPARHWSATAPGRPDRRPHVLAQRRELPGGPYEEYGDGAWDSSGRPGGPGATSRSAHVRTNDDAPSLARLLRGSLPTGR